MRNSEVYAYIESLYDAIHSGEPGEDTTGEVLCTLMRFEEEVRKEMVVEAKQKSGFDSTPFFTNLAESTYDELINFGERMDRIHPELGKFMQYLMTVDDPTFLIIYGDEHIKVAGYCSGIWAYLNTSKVRNNLLQGIQRSDSDDK